jgi:hypothetical protein
MKIIALLATFTAGLVVVHANAETVLLSNDFGGGTDIGPAFQEVANGLGTGGFSNAVTGVITTGSTTGQNSAYGLNTQSTVDATSVSGATAFKVEWIVSGANLQGNVNNVRYNGWFFGVTANTNATGTGGTSLWNQEPDAIGIRLLSSDNGNMQFIQDANSGDEDTSSLGVSLPSLASLQDGFTISLTVNSDDTWSASSTGLSSDFDASGSLTAKNSYADLADNLVAYTSIQGDGLIYTADQVTVTAIPEPSTLCLGALGLLGLIGLTRRKR